MGTRTADSGTCHAPADFGKAFAIGTALQPRLRRRPGSLRFVGKLARARARPDAGHNIEDVIGALFTSALRWASHLGKRKPTPATHLWLRSLVDPGGPRQRHTTARRGRAPLPGRRFAAFPNRRRWPSGTVIWVASLGIAINLGTALLFLSRTERRPQRERRLSSHARRRGGLRRRGPKRHPHRPLTGVHWIDPLVSLLINIVIVAGTWSLLRDASNLALDAASPQASMPPRSVPISRACPKLSLQFMIFTSGRSARRRTALTAHLVRPVATTDDGFSRCASARNCANITGIAHATLQVERGGGAHPCAHQSRMTRFDWRRARWDLSRTPGFIDLRRRR